MSIKQAIEALELAGGWVNAYGPDEARDKVRIALAALRSMPAEPYAYAVYFPKEFREELAHNLDELLDDLTNCEHTITPLFATPHTEAVHPELLLGWTRYEKLRKLKPFEYDSMCVRNLKGENFEEMVDALPAVSTPIPHTEAVRMSEAEIRRWWSSENGFEDLDMCKIDDFRTIVRAVEQATAARLGVKMGDV